MAGQEHVLRALVNGLERGRVHHAYLFTGTRGVGKTSVARILAKCLNCEKGVSAAPCGDCSACVEIDEGRFVDLIEVDAASRTKVEDTRELLDNVQYAPTRGRYKIYLIDEVHMLSSHSFNALLKTLEEPPPHVKFLLATTDPQKLPVTILSRCLQFNLKRMPSELIVAHLRKVLSSEQINAEGAALARLARAADGSMRDALSLLDQAIAFAQGNVDDSDVRAMLGALESDFVFEILEALAAGDGGALVGVVQRLEERAPDFADALGELLSTLHTLALAQVLPDTLDADDPEYARLKRLAETFSPEDVQLYYQIAGTGRRDLALAPDPRIGFEMVLLRMLAFRPQTVTDPPAASDPLRPAPAEGAVRIKAAERSERPKEGRTASQTPPEDQPDSREGTGGADWDSMLTELGLSGMAHMLAMHCEWLGREAETVRLRLDKGHEHLHQSALEKRIESALQSHFREPALRLRIELGQLAGDTPAILAERADETRRRAAEQSIQSDPQIAALRDTFDAEVIPDSIQPID